MGVEYYIINKENKTFFDLGKGGCWYYLNEDSDKSYLTDVEYLEEYIFADVFGGYEESHPIDREYCKEIAEKLFKFWDGAKLDNIVVCSDSGDDSIVLRALKYKCVGTRYRDSKYQTEEDRIEFENRHFNPSTPRHFYDPVQIKRSCPHLFDKYEQVQ